MKRIKPLLVTGVFSFGGILFAQQKPNVVFIITDDLGYGDLSCFGQERFLTPNIDRLAFNGTRFTRSYSGTTVSAPSRASLMTGLHTGHAPIRGNKEMEPEGQFPLPEDAYGVPFNTCAVMLRALTSQRRTTVSLRCSTPSALAIGSVSGPSLR